MSDAASVRSETQPSATTERGSDVFLGDCRSSDRTVGAEISGAFVITLVQLPCVCQPELCSDRAFPLSLVELYATTPYKLALIPSVELRPALYLVRYPRR